MQHPEGDRSAGGTTRPEGRGTTGGSVWERDDTDEPQLVRPYTLTAGRTDSRTQSAAGGADRDAGLDQATALAGERRARPDPDHVRR